MPWDSHIDNWTRTDLSFLHPGGPVESATYTQTLSGVDLELTITRFDEWIDPENGKSKWWVTFNAQDIEDGAFLSEEFLSDEEAWERVKVLLEGNWSSVLDGRVEIPLKAGL